jgi:hypothetical protein
MVLKVGFGQKMKLLKINKIILNTMKHIKPFEQFLNEDHLNEDFTDVSAKFKDALDNLPQKGFTRAAVEDLIKKHKEKRPDSAMAYAEKAYGWLMKEAKMPEPRKDEYYFLVRNSDAKDVWKMADDEFGNDIDRGRIEVLFQKNKYVIKDFELAKRFYQYLRDRGVKFFDQNFVKESVEVDEAIELFSLYTPIEFAQEWAAAYGEDLQQEYSGLYKELLKLKRFTVLDITRLWKKLYGEDFKKEYSALYKKLDK